MSVKNIRADGIRAIGFVALLCNGDGSVVSEVADCADTAIYGLMADELSRVAALYRGAASEPLAAPQKLSGG